jgi:hypothetical protein
MALKREILTRLAVVYKAPVGLWVRVGVIESRVDDK